MVFGTIAATGEEIHTSILPTELFRHDTPDAVVGHLRSRDEALGMHIQVWYCPRRHSLFGDPRVMYVSEYGTLPSHALGAHDGAGSTSRSEGSASSAFGARSAKRGICGSLLGRLAAA